MESRCRLRSHSRQRGELRRRACDVCQCGTEPRGGPRAAPDGRADRRRSRRHPLGAHSDDRLPARSSRDHPERHRRPDFARGRAAGLRVRCGISQPAPDLHADRRSLRIQRPGSCRRRRSIAGARGHGAVARHQRRGHERGRRGGCADRDASIHRVSTRHVRATIQHRARQRQAAGAGDRGPQPGARAAGVDTVARSHTGICGRQDRPAVSTAGRGDTCQKPIGR